MKLKRIKLPPVEEWTVEDWRDLHETVEHYRKRLAKRHAKPPTEPTEKERTTSDERP